MSPGPGLLQFAATRCDNLIMLCMKSSQCRMTQCASLLEQDCAVEIVLIMYLPELLAHSHNQLKVPSVNGAGHLADLRCMLT